MGPDSAESDPASPARQESDPQSDPQLTPIRPFGVEFPFSGREHVSSALQGRALWTQPVHDLAAQPRRCWQPIPGCRPRRLAALRVQRPECVEAGLEDPHFVRSAEVLLVHQAL